MPDRSDILLCKLSSRPAFLDIYAKTIEAYAFDSCEDFFHALLDNAGNYKVSAVFEVTLEMVFHSYEYISNYICCDYVILTVDLCCKLFISKDIAELGLVALRRDMILFSILFSCSSSVLVDIDSNSAFSSEEQCSY